MSEQNNVVETTAQTVFENKSAALTRADSNDVDLSAIKGIQGDLDLAVRYALRSMLQELTLSGKTLQDKKALIQSIERAVLFAFDYDIQATKASLKESGPLAKKEAQLSALIAKLIDNTILLKTGKELGEE
jgi:hypothetical protein